MTWSKSNMTERFLAGNSEPFQTTLPLKKICNIQFLKKYIYLLISYLGKLLLSAKSTLENTFRDIIPCVNLKIAFKSKNRWSSEFTFKEKDIKKCVPHFVTSFSVVAAVLLIMFKLNVSLRFVSSNIRESLYVQVKI